MLYIIRVQSIVTTDVFHLDQWCVICFINYKSRKQNKLTQENVVLWIVVLRRKG